MKFNRLLIIWLYVFCLVANTCCVSSDSERLANGLKKWEKNIPLPYHPELDNTVKRFASQPLPYSLQDYFPTIDSALLQRNMPWEFKYLPMALSGMRPNCVQGDRCGLWQLPPLTAMHYGLTVDETRDERFDVEASTRAALDYLNELYQQYGDWWYSILAYTNSPIALQHTLTFLKETPELWDFREKELLPNTQIIPDFIACIYLGHENHLHFVEKSAAELDKADETTAQDATTTINTEDKDMSPSSDSSIIHYTIKKGDILGKIAVQYHVTVSDLMTWDELDSDFIREGQTIIIKQ